ncbi:MAG: chemotaxis protein CheX [Pseudobacteriovorax sp.]|nr:chemotaxis protein CheX [Pseudobacteriovorax sp.]
MDTEESAFQDILRLALSGVVEDSASEVDGTDTVESKFQEEFLASIVGIRGQDIQGTVIVGCEESFLATTCPCYNESDPAEIKDALIEDWIGELSNLLVGRIKNLLLSNGLSFELSPPSVGQNNVEVFSRLSSEKSHTQVIFETKDGDSIVVMIAYEVSKDASIDSVSAEHRPLKPGSGVVKLENFNPEDRSESVTVYDSPVNASREQDPKINPVPPEASKPIDVNEERLGELTTDDIDESNLSEVLSESQNLNETPAKEESPVRQADSPEAESVCDAATTQVAKPTKTDTTSFEYLTVEADHIVRLAFSGGLQFRLDVREVYRSGLESFELQNLQVQIAYHNDCYSLSVGGVMIDLVADKIA